MTTQPPVLPRVTAKSGCVQVAQVFREGTGVFLRDAIDWPQ